MLQGAPGIVEDAATPLSLHCLKAGDATAQASSLYCSRVENMMPELDLSGRGRLPCCKVPRGRVSCCKVLLVL